MSDVRSPDEQAPASSGARGWSWVWAVAIVTAALIFLVGPVGIVGLGVGLLAGGLWVRRETPADRDRAIAGGLAAAGAAILVVTAAAIAFLMPVSVDSGTSADPVEDVVTTDDR